MKYFHTVLICFGILVSFEACKSKTETTSPIRKTITESVYASGKIKAKSQYTVYATVNGILGDVRVKPGDTVFQHEVLFLLDNVTSSLNSENARLALEFSKANSVKNSDKLKELALNTTVAYNRFQLDSLLFIKQKNLWAEKIGTQIDFEQKEMQYKTSKSNYEIAKNKLSQIKTQLENETKRASVNYSISKKLQNDFIIRSELNGTVYDVLKEKGELITPQTPLAIIGLSNQFLVEMQIDEKDIARIKKDQKVEITLDSYKGEVFPAKITSIYPIMDERSRTFTVTAEFTSPPKVLYPNLSIEANVLIQSKKDALLIPTSYLTTDSSVILENKEIRQIKTGLRDYDFVEVLDGLKTEDILLKP